MDAPAKVTGAAVYTTDVTLPDMLYAAIRRSEVAAGLVGRITFPDGTPGIDVLPDDRVFHRGTGEGWADGGDV